MVSQKQSHRLLLQYLNLPHETFITRKKDWKTEKQTGSCSQSTTAELHHNADPGCFVDYQILGSGRYSEESFTWQDFVMAKVPRRDCHKAVLEGVPWLDPKGRFWKMGFAYALKMPFWDYFWLAKNISRVSFFHAKHRH